jgi:nicotinate-nucleotide adenylyltransferase
MIGLFFGSFNPIHIGNLALANYMRSFHRLQEVWFVVTPHNPHKAQESLLADHHRLELVRLAIGDEPGYRASNIEFGLAQPNYTIHTLAHLEERYPGKQFCLIMGADNLSNLPKWKNGEVILERYPILVYPRKDWPWEAVAERLRTHPGVTLTEAPLLEISASFIRRALAEEKEVQWFMPEAVARYVKEMGFYRIKK